MRPSAESSSPNDEKRSRRFSFSSALRRVSRSRSRPNSVAISNSTASIFGNTPKDMPSHERSRFFGGRSRPHSYHAPELWNSSPSRHRSAEGQLTFMPPRFEPRLGILLSPAKSAFSTEDQHLEEIPPVPPIPNAVAQRHHRRMSQDSTHQMLESVGRYSKPLWSNPASRPSYRKSDTRAGAQEMSEAWKGPQVSEKMLAMPGDLEHPALRPVRPSSAPHVLPRREDGNINVNRRSLSAILGSMPFTFAPAELQMLAQVNKDKKQRKTRRPSSTVSRESAEYHRASESDHGNLLAPTGYLPQFHSRPVFDDDDQLRFAQDLVPVSSERGGNWPIVSSAFPSLHHINTRNAVFDHVWQPIGDANPTIPRQASLGDRTGVDDGRQTSPSNRAEAKVDIVSVGDVPVVLQRADTHEVPVIEEQDSHHRNDLRIHDNEPRRMSFQADITRSDDVTPVSFLEKANALMIPSEYEKHRESPSSLSSLSGAARHQASDRASENERRRIYETEMIGAGDISPISTRSFSMMDEEANPQVERIDPGTTAWFAKSKLQFPKQDAANDARGEKSSNPKSNVLASEKAAEEMRKSFDSQKGKIALGPGIARDETLISADRAPQTHSAASLDTTRPMPYAVHAVEEYSASSSSLASLDHDDSNAALPEAPVWRDSMKDENDLVTPVANVPRIVQNGPPAHKAEGADDNHVNPTSDDYFPGHPSSSVPMQQNSQLQPIPSANMTVPPQRSRSILSQISAMVSDADTLSPTASSAGRSTPSTIRRMNADSSTKSPANPNQILEEAVPTWTNPTTSDHDSANDYDLYEDQNGFVKDVPKDSRQLPRDIDHPKPSPAVHYHARRASVAGTASVPASRDGERPRYSTERPMSFVSGPPDEAGKPQDQINRFGPFGPPSDTQVPQIPEQHRIHSGQPQTRSIGIAISSTEKTQEHWSPGPVNPNYQPAHETAQSNVARALPNSSLPQHVNSAQARTLSGNQVAQNDSIAHHNASSPHGLRNPPGQYATQGAPNRKPIMMPDHDPMAQGQFAAARNQHEYHQRMMQHQTNGWRREDTANQVPVIPVQYVNNDAFVPEEKRSSKPRLASKFKGIVGKHQQGLQQQTTTPTASASSVPKPQSMDPVHNYSSFSTVDSLSTTPESIARKPNGPPHPNPHHYQTSLGTEPQYHQGSQPVAPAQPADFPFNGRSPGNIAQYRGTATQQHAATTPNSNIPPFYQAPTSGPMETGKKKRFSALGALFGRVNTAGDLLLAKSKEKKAQKAQRYSIPALAPTSQENIPQPQPQQFKPEQPTLSYYPPGHLPPPSLPGVRPTGPQIAFPQVKLPPVAQDAQNILPRMGAPQLPQIQQRSQQYQQVSGAKQAEPGSAYLRTKQLREEHHAQRGSGQVNSAAAQNTGTGTQASPTSMDQRPANPRQFSWGTSSAEYYKPKHEHYPAEHGVNSAVLAMQQQADHRRQNEEAQSQASHERSQAEQMRAQQQHRQTPPIQQDVSEDSRMNRQQMHQHQQLPMFNHGVAQGELQQYQQGRQQAMSQKEAYEAAMAQRQQSQPHGQQPLSGHGSSRVAQVQELQRQQQQQQQQQRQYPSQVNDVQYMHNNRSVSGPPPVTHIDTPVSQRHVSSPITEPQYDAPPIPPAYSHVSGAFVSSHEQLQQPVFSPQHDPRARFDSTDSGMQSISPQISAQSEMPRNDRTHSDTSVVSMISPISNSPDLLMTSPPPPNQRMQQQRMSSIIEVHQHDRPWHLNFPEGATEQEIVRARQRQYMEEQFTTQQQLHAERAAQSPSPNTVPTLPTTGQDQAQGGGFREVLPRTTPQQYPSTQPTPDYPQEVRQVSQPIHPIQPSPVHPGNLLLAAAYPLPSSPDPGDIRSPVNPIAETLPPPPPPKLPHSPMIAGFPTSYSPSLQEQRRLSHISQQHNTPPPHEQQRTTPAEDAMQYEQTLPDEPPPSYDGPSVPQSDIDKNHPDRPRPSDIDTSTRDSQPDIRSRQASIGILQHPQPASMAASPQRSSADMGAESLRRQLLQQEEYARMERIQRAQMARVDSERERKEREAARARARELELSASGGGQVGSLRRVGGSRSGGAPGWERRGSSSARPVFELPAEEDEEPAMKATSYPGQEWVPMMWDD
ncbi:hypothetical protein J1614_007691 [Plenodomus biglobosus]|nr:hypothetical protein J1614_007691 [Plenodomus biglobosus]